MKITKRTKIVCTIGPASATAVILRRMIRAGMNAARLNLSHGAYPEHRRLIQNIRAAAKAVKEPLVIIGDLQGGKIRVGDLPPRGIKLVKGAVVEIPVTHKNLYREVKRGERVLLEDGLMDGLCLGGSKGKLKIKVRTGGTLLSHKGLNFPDSILKVAALTDKDKKDAIFCAKAGVHYLALSFVASAKDIFVLRRLLKEKISGRHLPMIIAKIEKSEALSNFDEILAAADGIMIARGDLGVEIPVGQVPLAQKTIIEKCRAAGKPVIVATQMLDSMTRNPYPTRAEVSDVANAVIDHTDAVMLSGETATGKYPVETVATMAKIIKETETSPFDDLLVDKEAAGNSEALISHTLRLLAAKKHIQGILSAIYLTPLAERFNLSRPEVPFFLAAASEGEVCRLNLRWGVCPFLLKKLSGRKFVKKSLTILLGRHLIKPRQKLALVLGQKSGLEILEI